MLGMDGLLVKNIPRPLLARILVQLYIIPQQLIKSPQFDLLAVLAAGLRDYGDGEDLNGFLSFCAKQSICPLQASTTLDSAKWLWRDYTLCYSADWDDIDRLYLQEKNASQDQGDTASMIGLRLQLATEQVRRQIELVRYGRKLAAIKDRRFTREYQGHHIRYEEILNGALDHLSRNGLLSAQQSITTTQSSLSTTTTTNTKGKYMDCETLKATLERTIERVAKARKEYEKKYDGRPETDFVLMGALMVKLDATQTGGALENDWYLYLRDFTLDMTGSNWRIINGSMNTTDQAEMRVSSDQVLADLRGIRVKNDQDLECIPSPTSNNYRPVYLFYCNNDIVTLSAQDSLETEKKSNSNGTIQHDDDKATISPMIEHSNKDQSITLDDDSFKDDKDEENDDMNYALEEVDYDENDEFAMEMCKFCGIPDSIDDINTIFFCDECNQGVHQLCEQPPIAAFEMNIDPWYCRACCAMKGLPLPTPPPYIHPQSETATPIAPVAPESSQQILGLEPEDWYEDLPTSADLFDFVNGKPKYSSSTQHQSDQTSPSSTQQQPDQSSSSSLPTSTTKTDNTSTSLNGNAALDDETDASSVKKRRLDE